MIEQAILAEYEKVIAESANDGECWLSVLGLRGLEQLKGDGFVKKKRTGVVGPMNGRNTQVIDFSYDCTFSETPTIARCLESD
jgi:hypothetical protein